MYFWLIAEKLKDKLGSADEYVLFFIRNMSLENVNVFANGKTYVSKVYEMYS